MTHKVNNPEVHGEGGCYAEFGYASTVSHLGRNKMIPVVTDVSMLRDRMGSWNDLVGINIGQYKYEI